MSAEKKLTAVEWFAEEYNLFGTAEYEKTKELEKQQIIDAYEYGINETEFNRDYYKETFKNDN